MDAAMAQFLITPLGIEEKNVRTIRDACRGNHPWVIFPIQHRPVGRVGRQSADAMPCTARVVGTLRFSSSPGTPRIEYDRCVLTRRYEAFASAVLFTKRNRFLFRAS
jgi:hypothetical protein